jgi:hypothetical protein
MPWSATFSLDIMVPVVTGGDLLVYYDVPAISLESTKRGISPTPSMAIRRRNNGGDYELVANITESAAQFSTTNGKWIALLSEGVELFHINENNKVSNMSVIPTYSGFLLSDDTFVGFVNEDDNYFIRTFEYDAANNNWTSIAHAELSIPFDVNWEAGLSSYRASDTHLVVTDSWSDNVTVQIYERQADLSWEFVEAVPINETLRYANVIYNGLDTIVISLLVPEGAAYGVVFIYTKMDGAWTEHKLTPASVGYRPIAYFGLSVVFVDPDTLLIGAGLEGYGESAIFQGGKVLMVTRSESGSWEPVLDLAASTGLFGLGVGVNNHDIIVSSLNPFGGVNSFYAAPRCFTQPINVTCVNQQVDDCSLVTTTGLYTVNNPQCGVVTALLNGFSLVNNQAVQAHFEFTKSFGPTVYCNATVTCPAPQIDVPTASVSGASAMQIGLASLFGTALMLL